MMNHNMLAIETQHYIDEVVVTIVKVSGRLDGATSSCFLNTVYDLVERGEDHIIFDLQEISTLGSGGLIALHQVAKLLLGEPMSLHDFGWGSFHALEHDLTRGESLGLKILRPSPRYHRDNGRFWVCSAGRTVREFADCRCDVSV